jgi:hypothetical protein
MHPIWTFYLGAMTGVLVTMAALALFAVGSRADKINTLFHAVQRDR